MSKVYSFRLSNDNPREAQAREVIEAWVGGGYSLRYVVVEALLSFNNKDAGQNELDEVIEQLQGLILSIDKQSCDQTLNDSLPHSFLISVKQSARKGVTSDL